MLFSSYDATASCWRDAGLADARPEWTSSLVPGAVAGAAHAMTTTPLVIFQRSGRLRAAHVLEGLRPPVIVRDAASYSCFFAVHAALWSASAAAKERGSPSAALSGAAAGGAAGVACHAVRFPLQTVYKRGQGWIADADLRPSALAHRFATTGVRAGLSAALAFGVLEVAIGTLDDHAGGAPRR